MPSSSIQPRGDHLLLRQVALQRGEDAARMQRERAHAGVPAERVELHGEQHVGRLRLPVRLPLVVAVLELDVVPADAGAVVPVEETETTRAPPPARSPARAG